MVEHVEEVGFKLEAHALGKFEGLAEAEIGIEESWPNQRVAYHFALVAP